MIVTLVQIWVKGDYKDAFIDATVKNQAETLKEPGNLRFDFLQDSDDPLKFVLYEVFADEQAILDHKATTHYMTWRDIVADWMQQPRKGVKHSVISPLDPAVW
ncbi:MAG TPA: antibiotic biosynthesis monooxygenase [Bacteroidales bacterium]|nr:antibiotic biosynthesis monooxygenase [Bacteroidales bacterium]